MLQLQFVNFKKDSYLIVEGKENNDHFYIIQSGKVICTRSSDKSGATTKYLGAGDFVGVIPCMSSHFQIESARALEDTRCISVKKDQYPELIEKNTPIALKIIRTFANRMRTMNDQVAQAIVKTDETPRHMYEVAAYYDKVSKYSIALYAYYHYMKECPDGAYLEQAKERFKNISSICNFRNFEAPQGLTRNYNKDEMIFSESQSGGDMFVIQEGEVAISKIVNGNEVLLAVLKRGDMFGEMALLENMPRSASAIAHSQCTLMVINRQNFDHMVATQPQLIARLTTSFAERLWTSYRQLDNAIITNPAHKMIDMLALQAEKARKFTGEYQTGFTLSDLANMCSIPLRLHNSVFSQFRTEKVIDIIEDKITVKDCSELFKLAAFYRKYANTREKNSNL